MDDRCARGRFGERATGRRRQGGHRAGRDRDDIRRCGGVVNDRGRAEYWFTVASTQMMLIPCLTGEGKIDLCDVRDAVLPIARR